MDNYFEMAVEATLRGIDAGLGGPFGATIVRGDEVIVAVGNRQMADRDPSQHAEMVAVREACKRLGTMDLSDCTVYATCEPCPMCVGVMIWAGIKDCYYAATHDDAANHGFSDIHLREFLAGQDDAVINLTQAEHRADCVALFTTFRERYPDINSMS